MEQSRGLYTIKAVLERKPEIKPLFWLDSTIHAVECIEAPSKQDARIKFYKIAQEKFPQYIVKEIREVTGPIIFRSKILLKMIELLPRNQ